MGAPLKSEGLADIANRELQRELAYAYLLNKNYREAAASFKQVLSHPLAADSETHLLLAQAQYHLKDYVGVVATLDTLVQKGLPLDSEQLRQAMALFCRAGAYSQCAVLLKRLLVIESDNADYWHQLAAVYLLQNQRRAALDQLALARSKGVAFSEQQLLLLADLYAANKNPYAAAQLMQSAIAQQDLAANAANYRKLFEYWLHAREKDKARLALAEAARRSNDITLYLYLAQLQMEQESFKDMRKTMIAACAKPLDETYVSRANLLLGISQLKLGETEAARRSFINASLIGGATEQAAQRMQYMDAAPATKQEARAIVSICRGPKDQSADLANVATEELELADDGAGLVNIKEVPPQRFYTASHRMPAADMGQQAPTLAIRLTVKLIKAGGSANGPLHIIGTNAGTDPDAATDFILALPTTGNPRSVGRYKLLVTEALRCTFIEYEGPPEGIAEAWQGLVRDTLEAGYAPSGESRTVFAASGAAAAGSVRLELQLGIE